MDRLTKVLVALYEEPEKPSCALDFMKHHLGAAAPENPEVEALHLEVAEMKENSLSMNHLKKRSVGNKTLLYYLNKRS
uniref:c-Myc-binding protein n=1 Tax=Podarcis muralis TaxID=64176 RepID=A0A670JDH9_PODMU